MEKARHQPCVVVTHVGDSPSFSLGAVYLMFIRVMSLARSVSVDGPGSDRDILVVVVVVAAVPSSVFSSSVRVIFFFLWL